MFSFFRLIGTMCVVFIASNTIAAGPDPNVKNYAYTAPSENIPPKLTRHSATMGKKVYQVTDRIYLAVGYGIANITMLVDIVATRYLYMYGSYLEKGREGVVNLGIGPALIFGTNGIIPPTKTFDDTLDLEIAGIRMHLFHVPSEAEDEIAIWLPDNKVLQTAEVLQGECFPNIYTIRGASYRNPVKWYKSIDRMRGFPADYIVPSHGRHVSGKKKWRRFWRLTGMLSNMSTTKQCGT